MKQNSILTFFGVVLLLISGFHLYYQHRPNQPSDRVSSAEKNASQVVRVAAAGDIMLHSPQIRSGQKQDGTYDFTACFKEVKPYFASADLSVANLEVTLGGRAPYTGYPQFNAPDALADAVKYAGIDIVSTANNHAMDTGVLGLKRTHRIVNEKGLKSAGTFPTKEERKATIIKKKGISFAFLAYTESTNGLPVPELHLLNTINPRQIAEDITDAKKQGADFVIVSLHFGAEYQRTPNLYQRGIAQQVFENGADVILGSHPHVIQEMKRVTVNGKEKLVIYSLGNFISNQRDPFTDEGVIVFFDVEKKNGQTSLKDVSFLPTFCHRYYLNGKPQYVIIPMDKEKPTNTLSYPGVTEDKWRLSYTHTHQKLRSVNSFPVFYKN